MELSKTAISAKSKFPRQTKIFFQTNDCQKSQILQLQPSPNFHDKQTPFKPPIAKNQKTTTLTDPNFQRQQKLHPKTY